MTLPSQPRIGAASALRGLFTLRVARKSVEAIDICSFELVDEAAASLPPFAAGAHINVAVTSDLVRQYSLCNHPSDRHRYQIAVLRDKSSRGGSVAMHDTIHEGDLVQVSAPLNHFPLAAEASHSILLAGGIGITPILCMSERLEHAGASFELHYCSRSQAHMAFRERIERASFANRASLYFDDAHSGQMINLDAILAAPNPRTHVYVCGPPGFIDWALRTAEKVGWPESNVHREFFKAELHPTLESGAFHIKLSSTGETVVVAPNESVIQALTRVGIDIPTSCEQGVCGTCITRVLEGVPEHRDLFMMDAEHAANDQFTPCCSRAKTSLLVLDI